MTQAQLAVLAERDQALISKLERGEHTNPTKDTIDQLAKALGIAPSELQFTTPRLRQKVSKGSDRQGHTQKVAVG